MNIVPWYVYAFLSLPALLVGLVMGVMVADLRRIERPLIVIAAAVGAVAGEWLGVLGFRAFFNSMWPPACIGAGIGSGALSLAAAWVLSRRGR